MMSKQLNNLNYPCECWKSHFRGINFKISPGEHAPLNPLHAPARSGRLPETRLFVKPGSAPAVFQYSTSVKVTADTKIFKGPNTKLEDTLIHF